MTGIENLAPVLDALSDEEFEALLTAAVRAAGESATYQSLSPAEKSEIDAALARLNAGAGLDVAQIRARLAAKLC